MPPRLIRMSCMLDAHRSVYLKRIEHFHQPTPLRPRQTGLQTAVNRSARHRASLTFFLTRRRGDGRYKSPKLRLFFKGKEEVGG